MLPIFSSLSIALFFHSNNLDYMINKSLTYVMCLLCVICLSQLDSEHFKMAGIFINFVSTR